MRATICFLQHHKYDWWNRTAGRNTAVLAERVEDMERFKVWKAALLALATSMAAFHCAGAQQLVPVTLTTGWVFSGGTTAALLLADKRGYFNEGGVKINIVRGFGSADVVAKVAAKTYEAGTGYLPALVRAKAENPDLDAVAVTISYDASPDAITGPKGKGITTPKDLAGRRISAQPNSTSMLTFQPFAEATGIDPGSIKWVEVAPDLLATVVHQGSSEAVAQFSSSALSTFEKLGYKPDALFQFLYSDYVPNLYGNGLILRRSWAEQNPGAARGLVRGYIRGLIAARKSPQEAIDLLMQREPLLDRAAETNDFNHSNEKHYFTANVKKSGVGYHTKEDVTRFVQLLVKPFGLKRVPSAEEIYTDAYLPSLKDRLVAQ
jgi:NitT/TauT family transport system substrate-binding protein